MEDAINSFNTVTGNKNDEIAKFYLEMVNGDVQKAIVAYIESGGAEPDATEVEVMDDQQPDTDGHNPSNAKISTVSGKDDEEQR
jgi:hypothetical protein